MNVSYKKITATVIAAAVCLSMAACTTSDKSADPVVDMPSFDGASVSFLGPVGTYTQEACEKFFGEGISLTPYETVPDAVQALVDGESDYAVIPQENTIGGAVTDYIDTLISQPSVAVIGEVELPISQNLLVLPGTSLSDITTVYSHKQGIAQGRDWLAANLPDAEVIEVSSTAEGARMVSEGGDHSCAAIASAGCADVYGLEVLAPAIQNNDKNVTRFYVLAKCEPVVRASGRTAFIASGSASDIPALLSSLAERNITLIAIHDRPLKTELGQYYYIIECSHIDYSEYVKITGASPMEFRFLGDFDAV